MKNRSNPDSHKITVLVVDDDPATPEALRAHLRDEPHDVTYSTHAPEDLANRLLSRPDILIAGLPRHPEQAREFLDRILSDEEDHPEIVVLTEPSTDNDLLSLCFKRGIRSFLRKPVHAFELKALICNLIRLGNAASQQRRAEEESRKLSAAMEQNPASVVITDARGAIEYVNPTFTRITGYELEEIAGQNPRLLQSGETPEETYRDLWRTLTGGNIWRGEFVNRKKNGELFWEEASLGPIKNDRGVITHYIAIKEDVTARRESEREREALKGMLRQGQRLEALGTLTAGIAHEFNNLLAAILGSAELAQIKSRSNMPADTDLEQILNSCYRARDLVQKMLAFGRPAEEARTPLKMDTVLREGVTFVRAILPSSVDLRLHIEAEGVHVAADALQMHQLLLNLCSNACHAMRGREGTVEISLEEERQDARRAADYPGLKPGAYVKLSVRDSGQGIPPRHLDRIFDPFYTTKEPGEGSGMGLSVVHGIAKSHGGVVWAESTPDRGSVFHVLLPVSDRRSPAVSVEGETLPVGRSVVLVLDDEEDLLKILANGLKLLGYDAVAFNRAPLALRAFRANPARFDLVVTDMTMPDMNGIDFAHQVKSIRPDIPVILCTGYEDLVDPDKASRAGIQACLQKPVSLADLSNTMGTITPPAASSDATAPGRPSAIRSGV